MEHEVIITENDKEDVLVEKILEELNEKVEV